MKKRKILSFLLIVVLIAIMIFPLNGNKKIIAEDGYALANPTTDNEGNTIWDCIYFGKYYQNDTEGNVKEPIKWRVLKIEGNDAFLMADKSLDTRKWNETQVGVTWENCTLRSWLNGYGSSTNICGNDYAKDNFLDVAFTEEEQSAIETSFVENQYDPYYNSPSGNNTYDKIYLLSYTEALKTEYGFSSDIYDGTTRIVKNTPYAEAKLNLPSWLSSGWWLRSHGDDTYPDNWEYYGHYAVEINCNGFVYANGCVVDDMGHTVRPVLHFNIENTDLFSYAGTVSSDGTAEEITVPEETTTEEPTTSSSGIVLSEDVKIEGYQISANREGSRVIGSVEPTINGLAVEKWGFVYAIEQVGDDVFSVPDEEMYVGADNAHIMTLESTPLGTSDVTFGDSVTATYFVRTTLFSAKNAKEFTAKYKVRAYAVLSDGSYVYSNVSSYNIFDVSDKLYQNIRMSTYGAHQYLYNSILSVVDSSYKEVAYKWSSIIVRPE